MTLRPDLAGQRVQVPSEAPIYLIDDNGSRRWIPDPATYNNLFRDWGGVIQDISVTDIDQGPQIAEGACLARGRNSAPVYLIDQGQKRWVTSPAVMDKFHFSWNTVQLVPDLLLSYIPSGPDIT